MYKLIWEDWNDGVSHIVAMPRSNCPFTACGQHHWDYPQPTFTTGLATCLRCWAREIMEWSIEATKKGL